MNRTVFILTGGISDKVKGVYEDIASASVAGNDMIQPMITEFKVHSFFQETDNKEKRSFTHPFICNNCKADWMIDLPHGCGICGKKNSILPKSMFYEKKKPVHQGTNSDDAGWEVWEFEWGSAVKHREGDWTNLFLKPHGQEINLLQGGLKVKLHEDGIEFL